MTSSLVSSGNFIGRRAELAFLREQWKSASAGQPTFVSIIGDAGIGKSRLVDEFLNTVDLRDARLALGTCLRNLQAPYLPFKDILEKLSGTNQIPRRLARQGVGTATEEDKLNYLQSICDYLSRHAARHTVVAIIEDLQWIDDASAELLEFLLRRLDCVPILFLLTYRSEALESAPPVMGLLGRLSRLGCSRMHLPALSRDEIRYLAKTTAGGDPQLTPEVLRRIEDAAEGNPLFAEEFLRSALEGGNGLIHRNFPLTIKAMLVERFASLPVHHRKILTYAAVIGRAFNADFLTNICEYEREDVLDALGSALGLQLIVENDVGPHRYRFRHEIVREALYTELLWEIARPLHARIATILEAEVDAENYIGELAYHWTEAGIEDRAIDCNERAGDGASLVFAYSDAARYYRRAVSFPYPSGSRRAALCEKFAYALYVNGVGSEAEKWFRDALREYEQLVDRESAARVLMHLSRQNWLNSRTLESLEMASHVIEMFRDHDPHPASMRAHLTMARHCATLGRLDKAQENMDSLDLTRIHSSDEMTAEFYEIGGELEAMRGNAQMSFENFEKALDACGKLGSADAAARIENAYAICAADLGDAPRALLHHERSERVAREHGLSFRATYASVNYAHTLLVVGKYEEARECILGCLEAVDDTPTTRTRLCAVGLELGVHYGDMRLVERLLDNRYLEDAFASSEIQRVGSVVAAVIDADAMKSGRAAPALIDRAIPIVSSIHRCWNFPIVVGRYGSPAQTAAVRELFFLHGGPEKTPTKAAFFQLFEALTSFRSDAKADANAFADDASRRFAELGWGHWERISREVSTTGPRLRGAWRPLPLASAPTIPSPMISTFASLPATLTPRQREIALLVRDGNTNKQVAFTLGISENTVERHLGDIFSRLSISSRAQLAAWVENGLRKPILES